MCQIGCKITIFFHFYQGNRIFFSNFAEKSAKILRLGKKKNEFFCFALDFS